MSFHLPSKNDLDIQEPFPLEIQPQLPTSPQDNPTWNNYKLVECPHLGFAKIGEEQIKDISHYLCFQDCSGEIQNCETRSNSYLSQNQIGSSTTTSHASSNKPPSGIPSISELKTHLEASPSEKRYPSSLSTIHECIFNNESQFDNLDLKQKISQNEVFQETSLSMGYHYNQNAFVNNIPYHDLDQASYVLPQRSHSRSFPFPNRQQSQKRMIFPPQEGLQQASKWEDVRQQSQEYFNEIGDHAQMSTIPVHQHIDLNSSRSQKASFHSKNQQGFYQEYEKQLQDDSKIQYGRETSSQFHPQMYTPQHYQGDNLCYIGNSIIPKQNNINLSLEQSHFQLTQDMQGFSKQDQQNEQYNCYYSSYIPPYCYPYNYQEYQQDSLAQCGGAYPFPQQQQQQQQQQIYPQMEQNQRFLFQTNFVSQENQEGIFAQETKIEDFSNFQQEFAPIVEKKQSPLKSDCLATSNLSLKKQSSKKRTISKKISSHSLDAANYEKPCIQPESNQKDSPSHSSSSTSLVSDAVVITKPRAISMPVTPFKEIKGAKKILNGLDIDQNNKEDEELLRIKLEQVKLEKRSSIQTSSFCQDTQDCDDEDSEEDEEDSSGQALNSQILMLTQNKKNVVKNIMSAFKTFVLGQAQKQAIQKIYNSANQTTEEIGDIQRKFKRYISSKNFNHYSLRLLILHPNYGPIFKYFLSSCSQDWLVNSKIKDAESHEKMILFFLSCFDDIRIIDTLRRHPKKKCRFS